MILEEIWKDIKGYEGFYQVSNLGRVKSLKRTHATSGKILTKERVLTPTLYGKGYQCVRFAPVNNNDKKKAFSVHRLVATAFIDNPHQKEQVDHINRDKLDNRVENLRWVDNTENQHNTKVNKNITAFGETKCITEWSKLYNISVTAIKIRLRKGWSAEKNITDTCN